jgi:hypothetical protein
MTPPPLPEEILRRVLRVARFDGVSLLSIAGACALVSASYRDVSGAVVGLLVAGAGAVELHGLGLLRHGYATGMRWLVSSQLCVMGSIFGYAGYRMWKTDVSAIVAQVMAAINTLPPETREQLFPPDMNVPAYLAGVVRSFYPIVCLLTFLFQGGMAYYYLKRAAAVSEALGEAE